MRAIAALTGIKKLDTAILLWHHEKDNFRTITGIDPATESGPAKVLKWISKGRPLQQSGEVVVESHYARFNKLKAGDTVHFGEKEFRIVGVTKIKKGASLAAANFYIAMDDASILAAMDEGSANLLSVGLSSGTDKELIKKRLATYFPEALSPRLIPLEK